jgi:natural product precursor
MEDILYEPVELTESELDEVAGGWNECGCGCGEEGLGIGVAVAVAAAVAISL